jgi:hypothetical protein
MVGLARLNRPSEVLSIIHQGILGNGFSTGGVGLVEKLGDQDLHLLVVPIGEGQNDVLVNLVLVWKVGVLDNKWTPQTIWILTFIVRMVPVSTRLVDLN